MTKPVAKIGRAVLTVCAAAAVLGQFGTASALSVDADDITAVRMERKRANSDGKLPLPGTPDLKRLDERRAEQRVVTDAPIVIQNSQMSIVIENKVGMPLTDVDVSIVPVGGATEFRKFVGRMENAEKRDLSLGGFYGRDGTTFSLRVVRPRAVRVTGKDLNAKPYNVEARWQ